MSGTDPQSAAQALSVRLFKSALATQETLAAYLGVRLGLYEHLHAGGPASATVLAARTGLDRRYLREWLEQQAVSGFLVARPGDGTPDGRVFALLPGHERVLVASADPLSLVSTAVLPLGGVAAALPALLAAFGTGAGVPDAVFGDDWRAGHSGANRAVFTRELAGWLREHAPEAHARLGAGVARIVDIGCGAGWASLALARAYPSATVLGVDLDEAGVAAADARAREEGLAGRVSFRVADATTLQEPGGFDLVCLFDTLHEVPGPTGMLAACRRMRASGGHVIGIDARVADRFTAPGDDIERFQYATSLLHCLPAGRAAPDADPSGTVLRAADLVRVARAAGFTRVRRADLGDRFHRLYRLDG